MGDNDMPKVTLVCITDLSLLPLIGKLNTIKQSERVLHVLLCVDVQTNILESNRVL